ncbi:putative sporulation protein YtxC [Caldalkalibacillus mannanilyticus]|uniref:putative sporulation protein YtxC n=1 Tax=Caldalkalibacillus mannanilyticus TaxID=1418 RepID=UPI00046A9495|nr:putative sporulation protein YtxC [Caldalkalibacillus mannanilyticus]
MEILRIVPASGTLWNEFISFLEKELKCLEKDQFTFSFEKSEDYRLSLCCDTYPNHLSALEVVDTYRHYFSTAMSEFIVEHVEEEVVRQKIEYDFCFEDPVQIENIYRYCNFFLFLEEDHETRNEPKIVERKCKVFKRAYEYLEEERDVDLEGFIRFRLKEYYEELDEVIEYAVDEYILDKEYQEFIQLLRYFISKQESKVPFLHVYHRGGHQFLLFDGGGKRIAESEVESYMTEWSEHSIGNDDIIVSTLITMNPRQLHIHTEEPEFPVIQTLKKIFGDQVIICTHCPHCQDWKQQRRIEVKT